MIGSILKDVLYILNECTSELEITETEFLDTLYPQIKYTGSEKAKKKVASKIFSGDIASNKKNEFLKTSLKFTINDAFAEWLIEEDKLEEKIEEYINSSVYLDKSQKDSLMKKRTLESRMIELIRTGINGTDVSFNKTLIKTHLIGRDDDVRQLEALLEQYNICYLYGVNGIGKTTLIREYARTHPVNYIELKYNKSLKETLERSGNFRKQKSYDEVLKKLDDSVLLVIDDINENFYEDIGFEIIKKLSCKVVLVFYHEPDLQHEEDGDNKKMELKELSKEDLKKLFYKSAKRRKNDLCEIFEDDIEQLIKNTYQNTYFLILCANLIKSSCCKISDLNKKLIHSIIEVDDKVALRTEIYQGKKTYDQLAAALYDISDFSKSQKEMLFLLSNFRNWGIDRTILEKIWSDNSCNELNSLIERGWVDSFGNNVRLYAIPAEYVKNELNYNYSDNKKIFNTLMKNAMKLTYEMKFDNFSASWIVALYDIADGCVIQGDMEYSFLLDVFELLCAEYPNIPYLENVIKKMECFEKTFHTEFYAKHCQNILSCIKGNEDLARNEEKGLLEVLEKSADEAIGLNNTIEWCRIVGFQMQCFKTIRDSIKISINKGKVTDEFLLNVQELNNFEYKWSHRIRYVCEQHVEMKNKIRGYKSYFVNYYLYCLNWLDLNNEEKVVLLNYLEKEGEGIAIQVEIHRVKSRIEELKGNYIKALNEINEAMDFVRQLDSPLYYMECKLSQLRIELAMGHEKKRIMEQVEQLEQEYVYRDNNLALFASVENGIKFLKDKCSDVPNSF